MTKSMEKNSTSIKINIAELLKADQLLSCVKKDIETFSHNEIAIATVPKDGCLHFIKSEYFWKIFQEKAQKNNYTKLLIIADSKLKDLVLAENRVATCLLSTNVELSMANTSKVFYQSKFGKINHHLDGRLSGTANIHPSAFVSPLAFIGEYVEIAAGAEIMPGVYVGAHSCIGENTKLFPHVSIYNFVKIGKNCRIHSNTVIGADGFGYVFDKGSHVKIWHIGSVIIKDDVEIGANSCVDAGTFIPTLIGDKCIIDNQVQVAHNTQLGTGVVLCGQTGTAGSAKIGDYAVCGGRVAIGPQVEIGKYAKIAGGAMVTKSFGDGVELGGHPARPLKEWLRSIALLNRLEKTSKKDMP